MKIEVLKSAGSKAGSVEFPDEVFSSPVNHTLLWQAVETYRANARQGTAHTKTRNEVEGSGSKMFPQKHLGRARMGTVRSPIRVGGGVAFGPRPRSFRRAMPAKMRSQALLEAIKQKIQTGNLAVIEDIKLSKPKTKLMLKALAPLEFEKAKPVLLVLAEHSADILRAARNIANLNLVLQSNLDAYRVWHSQKLVLSRSVCKPLSERWK